MWLVGLVEQTSSRYPSPTVSALPALPAQASRSSWKNSSTGEGQTCLEVSATSPLRQLEHLLTAIRNPEHRFGDVWDGLRQGLGQRLRRG